MVPDLDFCQLKKNCLQFETIDSYIITHANVSSDFKTIEGFVRELSLSVLLPSSLKGVDRLSRPEGLQPSLPFGSRHVGG